MTKACVLPFALALTVAGPAAAVDELGSDGCSAMICDQSLAFLDDGPPQEHLKSPVEFSKESIDVDVLLAVIAERVREIAVMTVGKALDSAGKKPVPLYVSVLLDLVSQFLLDPNGIQVEKLEAAMGVVFLAMLADAVVGTTFPEDVSLAAAVRPSLGADAEITQEDGSVLRRYMTELAFWRLRAMMEERTQVEIGSGNAPACPGKEWTAFCKLFEGKDGPRMASETTGLAALETAIKMMAEVEGELQQYGPGLDTAGFLVLAKRHPTVASFGQGGDIDLESTGNQAASLMSELAETGSLAGNLAVALQSIVDASTTPHPGSKQETAAEKKERLDRYTKGIDLAVALLGTEGSKLAQIVPGPMIQETRELLEKEKNAATSGPTGEPALPAGARTSLQFLSKRLRDKSSTLGNASLKAGDLRIGMWNMEEFLQEQGVANGAAGAAPCTSVDCLPVESLDELSAIMKGLSSDCRVLFEFLSDDSPVAESDGGLGDFCAAINRLEFVVEMITTVAPGGEGGGTAGDVLSRLRPLVTGTGADAGIRLLDLLRPVLELVRERGVFDEAVVASLIRETDIGTIMKAFGFGEEGADHCESSDSPRCWTARILSALKASMDVGDDRLTIDAGVLTENIALLGDQFGKRNKGRFFFHLTIGVGGALVLNPPDLVDEETGQRTERNYVFAPLLAEQIGFGWAFPTIRNAATFKIAFFGSGILYRLLFDSRESDAIISGATIAVDLYELVELYVSVGGMLYMPHEEEQATGRFIVAFGIQVPLGDYIARIGQD